MTSFFKGCFNLYFSYRGGVFDFEIGWFWVAVLVFLIGRAVS